MKKREIANCKPALSAVCSLPFAISYSIATTVAIESGACEGSVSVTPPASAFIGTAAFVPTSHAFFGVPPHDGSASVPFDGQSKTLTYRRSPLRVRTLPG